MGSEQQPSPVDDNRRPGWLHVIQSVLAALFGVQSSKNRERDFASGKPADYIFIGIIAIVVFVLSLVGLVKWIMADAGY